ncbi:MAG: hypothetical protein IPM53_13490 [Anaerolineaceae bacterium]|nr:hypothetical protein [Anaerolineaceae bacterium]
MNKKRNRRNWLVLVVINAIGLLLVSDWLIGSLVAVVIAAVSYVTLTRIGIL